MHHVTLLGNHYVAQVTPRYHPMVSPDIGLIPAHTHLGALNRGAVLSVHAQSRPSGRLCGVLAHRASAPLRAPPWPCCPSNRCYCSVAIQVNKAVWGVSEQWPAKGCHAERAAKPPYPPGIHSSASTGAAEHTCATHLYVPAARRVRPAGRCCPRRGCPATIQSSPWCRPSDRAVARPNCRAMLTSL